MNLLAPLFLLGGLLIAGPIIAHLIRRTTKERIRFSDTRLLEPSPPRLQRRSRIENWWLLALRCLIVAVLAAGFARPFFRQEIPVPPSTNAPRHVVVVLDDSASMRREGRWPDAVARARAAAEDLAADDRFALVTAGASTSLLISGERWSRTPTTDRAALVATTLAEHAPGWGPTRLDSAVEAALDEIAAMSDRTEGLATSRIVIVSDGTAGTRVAGLAGRDWPSGCTVEIAQVTGTRTADASLQWLGWVTTANGKRAARVRVTDHGGAINSLRLHLRAPRGAATDLAPVQSLRLAAGEGRVVLVEVPAELRDPLRLDLEGDEESFNNTLWLVPPQPREISLPYLTGPTPHRTDDPAHARFYVTRAVQGWRDPVVRESGPAPLQIVAAALTEDEVRRVRTAVEGGAFALVLLADASVIPTAAALAGETDWSAAPVTRKDALLGTIDFQHPLFAPFADPRYSDFTRVRFWKPVPVTLPENSQATVVARFDDGNPAVLEAAVGQGRVVVWGGDWSNVASQWVLSTKFVPWLQALVERAAGGPPRPSVAEVGETGLIATAADARWRTADGGNTAALAGPPAEPGLFQLEESGRTRWVALQVPVAESRSDLLAPDTWEQLGLPVEKAAVTAARATDDANQTAATDTATEQQQQFWRWLLIGAAVLLAIESIVAIAAARRPAEEAAA